MDLIEQFENATQDIKKLASKPSVENMLKLYSFYKQATLGNVKGKRPGMFNLAAKSKYDAWEKIQGMSSEEAKKNYIDLVKTLQNA